MRVVKIGDYALAEDTYVRIGDTVYTDDWIKMVGMTENGSVALFTADSGKGVFAPDHSCYADAKALYERRLAAATEGDGG